MMVTDARLPLLLHVAHFTARRHLAIAPDDASACEGGEAEKSNETHAPLLVNPGSRAHRPVLGGQRAKRSWPKQAPYRVTSPAQLPSIVRPSLCGRVTISDRSFRAVARSPENWIGAIPIHSRRHVIFPVRTLADKWFPRRRKLPPPSCSGRPAATVTPLSGYGS